MGETRKISGRCLCGSVTLAATVDQTEVDACHCKMCRIWSGGPMLAVDAGDAVRFDGSEHIGVYGSSDWAERGFCRNCGTHLFYRLRQPAHYALPAGLIDGELSWQLKKQIFIDAKPGYYEFANDTRNLTGAEAFAEFGAAPE